MDILSLDVGTYEIFLSVSFTQSISHKALPREIARQRVCDGNSAALISANEF